MPLSEQIEALASGTEVVIATPGRLLDLIGMRQYTTSCSCSCSHSLYSQKKTKKKKKKKKKKKQKNKGRGSMKMGR